MRREVDCTSRADRSAHHDDILFFEVKHLSGVVSNSKAIHFQSLLLRITRVYPVATILDDKHVTVKSIIHLITKRIALPDILCIRVEVDDQLIRRKVRGNKDAGDIISNVLLYKLIEFF